MPGAFLLSRDLEIPYQTWYRIKVHFSCQYDCYLCISNFQNESSFFSHICKFTKHEDLPEAKLKLKFEIKIADETVTFYEVKHSEEEGR